MSALWIVLGIVIYAAGFTAAVRAVHLVERRWPGIGIVGDDWMIAFMWPLFLIVAIAVTPFVLLYRFATRDLKGD